MTTEKSMVDSAGGLSVDGIAVYLLCLRDERDRLNGLIAEWEQVLADRRRFQ